MDMEAIKALAAAAAAAEDQTETSTFVSEPIAAGPALVRFVDYIEVGLHEGGEYMGKKKPDAEELHLTFEVCSPKHLRESDDKKWFPRITVKVKKKKNDKATFTKLIKKMIYGREGISHMLQMLGEVFMARIVHNTVEDKQGKKRVYENLTTEDGEWTIASPIHEDPVSGKITQMDVPAELKEFLSPCRAFVFDMPSKEQWDSIYIEGTYTRKVKEGDEMVEREFSKNFLQNRILEAKNFPGSAVEAMLAGLGDLPVNEEAPKEKPVEKSDAPADEASEVNTTESADTAGAESSKSDTNTSSEQADTTEEDPLAALGLM